MHRLASHKLNSEISNLKCRNQNVHNGFTRRNISDLEHLCEFVYEFSRIFPFLSFSQWAATRIPGLAYGQ
jgi:hypothetical protein